MTMPRQLLALAVPVVLLLSGCDSDPGPPPIPTPTATRITSVFSRAQTTTATGTLTGAAHGSVTVTGSSRSGFTIRIHADRVSGGTQRQIKLATSLTDTDCSPTNDSERARQVDFGVARIGPDVELERPALESTQGDLSYMRVLVLTLTGADDDSSCRPSTMGVARLRWTRPAALTGLVPVDDGATFAAMGAATLRAGRPVSYTVAQNDAIDTVAARFGLTMDELLYLNPRRSRGGSGTLFVDEVLNLDPADR